MPVVWHDDHVVMRGRGGRLARRLVAQLTLAEFKRAARPQPLPPRDTPCELPAAPPSVEISDAAASSSAAAGTVPGRDTPHGEPQAAPSGESSSASACLGSAEASGNGISQRGVAERNEGGGTGERGGLGEAALGGQLVRQFHDTAGRSASCVQPWAVQADDDLPTLAEVFKVRPALALVLRDVFEPRPDPFLTTRPTGHVAEHGYGCTAIVRYPHRGTFAS